MKHLLLVLCFFPGMILADSTTRLNSGVPQPTDELKVMTERLHLSKSQQDEIAPILLSEADKRKSLQDDTSLSPQQKHDQTGQAHRAALQQIKSVFTPEQMAQIEQEQQHPPSSPTHS